MSTVNFRFNALRSHRKETNYQTIHRQFADGYTENIFTPYEFEGAISKIAAGFDIYRKDKHELSFGVDYTDDGHEYFNLSQYTEVSGFDDYTYLRVNTHHHKTTIFDANYRLKFDEKQHFLELDYQVNSSRNSYPISDFVDNAPLFDQFLTENFVLRSIAADYTLPIDDKAIIETGIFRNSQLLESQNIFLAIDSIPVDRQFEYTESILGFYGIWKYPLGTIQLQVGLRYEYFKAEAQIKTGNFARLQNFSNLFPSLHLSYPINDRNTLNVGYSKRISRPNFHHTNAFQIVSPLFVWEYNPAIIPETSHNLEASFQKTGKKLNLGLSGFFRLRKDVILWTEFARADKQVFRYENAGAFHSYGLETTLKYEVKSFWNMQITANYYRDRIERNVAVTWRANYTSRINVKQTWDLGKNITADLVYSHYGKRQMAFSYVKPRNRVDLSLNGHFAAKRLTLGLRVVDVLDQNQIQRNSRAGNLSQKTTWDIQFQTFNILLSLNYKFYTHQNRSRNRLKRNYQKPLID